MIHKTMSQLRTPAVGLWVKLLTLTLILGLLSAPAWATPPIQAGDSQILDGARLVSPLYYPQNWGKLVQIPSVMLQFSEDSQSSIFQPDSPALAAPLVLPAQAPNQTQTGVARPPDSLPPGEWNNILTQIKEAEYHYTWYEPDGEYRAPNQAHGWQINSTAQGVQLTPRQAEENWQWGLIPLGYGYGDHLQTVSHPSTQTATKNRLDLRWDAILTEWHFNNDQGLKQNFSLTTRPQQLPKARILPNFPDSPDLLRSKNTLFAPLKGEMATLPLQLVLTVSGNLQPALTADNQTILFKNDSGQTILRYSDLYVYDAAGRQLPSQFSISDPSASLKTSLQFAIEETPGQSKIQNPKSKIAIGWRCLFFTPAFLLFYPWFVLA